MSKRASPAEDIDNLLTVWAYAAHLHRAAQAADEAAIGRALGALWNELAPGELDNPRSWAALASAPVSAVTPDELRTFTALLCAVWHNFAPAPAVSSEFSEPLTRARMRDGRSCAVKAASCAAGSAQV